MAADTVKNCTPDDGCVKHPKHVELAWQWNGIDMHTAASVGYFIEYIMMHGTINIK